MMSFCSISFVTNFLSQVAASPGGAWWQSGWVVGGSFALAVVVCFLIASAFSKAIRMPDQLGRIWLILFSIAIAGLIIATKWPPKFGVDLRGGINFIGQLNLDAFEDQANFNIRRVTAADIIGTLSQRINPGGVNEIVIRALGADKIEVIIPEVDEAAADEIWNRLVRTGHLQFRIVATSGTMHNKEITLAEEMASRGDTSRNIFVTGADGSRVVAARWYSLAREDVLEAITPDTIVPIKDVPVPGSLVRDAQTGRLIDMSQVPLRSKNPGMDFAKWLKQENIRNPQILMIEPPESMSVEGKHLTNIQPDIDQFGRPSVGFSLQGDGSSRMFRLTNKYKPMADGSKSFLGIVIDDKLHTAPSINSAISSRGVIEGRFTKKEVDDLIITLQSGKIDVALNPVPISKQFIQSTLGEDLKQKGFLAIGVSFVAIIFFMLIYYQWFAGTIANLTLLVNLLLILATVMAINQPITLTGLAGVVLTIGMAVDANVLIYERIREELQKGASLRAAFRTGFERAFVTIFDSNITTILSALILYVIGTEQLKGFAVTLILGILLSMFTAVFCSWTIFNIWERQSWISKVRMMQIFSGGTIDFVGKQRVFIGISIVVIIIGMVGLFSLGSRVLDIDLRGGSTAQIVLREPMDLDAVRGQLGAQDYYFGNEKVVFSATAINDGELGGRTFKVDSNVPSPEAGQEWKKLDEILTEVFKDKLELHAVKFDPASIKTEKIAQNPTTSLNLQTPNHTIAENSDAVVAGLNSISAWTSSLSTATASFNPTTASIRAKQDPEKPEAAPQENQPTPDKAPVTSETKQDAQPDAQPIKSEIESKGAPQDPVKQESGDSTTEPQTPPETVPNRDRYQSTIPLNFDKPITGKSIRTMLVETASRLDKPIEEDQMKLDSSELSAEASALATPAKSWVVTLQTNLPDDAATIVSAWAAKFNQEPYFPHNSDVGGQVAQDAQWQALAAVVASCLGIIIYLWIRFQNVAFGIAAVVALIHDVLVTVGALALTHYVADYMGFMMIDKFKINLSIIAAVLTIIGYSVNDTIVTFDRLREIRGKRIEMTPEMINVSVSQTLSRTILTAGTVFVTVLVLFVLGGESIHGFAFAMCVGVLAGTYSSVYIAAPVLLWLVNRMGLNAALHEQQAANA